jgi:hypothetical protein
MTELLKPRTRIDWRTPLHAQAEETYWTDVSEDGSDQPRRAIRWHVSEEGLGRIMRMEACWDCLAGFPAPPRPDTWATWLTSGFNFVHSIADSKRLVRNRQCPLCKAEITSEMLAIQLDTAWTDEDAALKAAKMDNLDDDRERFDRADRLRAQALGLIVPVAPPSLRHTVKRRGES